MSVLSSISLLTPFEIDLPKVRIGPNADGGYVLAGALKPRQTVLSYGISTEYRFDEELARRGHRVFMFDHTIEPISAPHPNMLFYSEGVAGVSQPERQLYSVSDHIAKYAIDGSDLILKMDVEGAEFEAFSEMPVETLCRFDQIVIEVHYLERLSEEAYRSAFDRVFNKINLYFTLFHVHANNSYSDGLMFVSGIALPGLIELSYIRSNLVGRKQNSTLYPTNLDYPSVPSKIEPLLWCFPFFPTDMGYENFERLFFRANESYFRIEGLKNDRTRILDVDWYRSYYADLSAYPEDFLRNHFETMGIREGRFGSAEELNAFERSTTL